MRRLDAHGARGAAWHCLLPLRLWCPGPFSVLTRGLWPPVFPIWAALCPCASTCPDWALCLLTSWPVSCSPSRPDLCLFALPCPLGPRPWPPWACLLPQCSAGVRPTEGLGGPKYFSFLRHKGRYEGWGFYRNSTYFDSWEIVNWPFVE